MDYEQMRKEVGTCVGAVGKVSNLEEALTHLSDRIKHIENNVGRLADKLKPVIFNRPVEEPGSPKNVYNGGDLVIALHNKADEIDTISYRISNLIDNLDI